MQAILIAGGAGTRLRPYTLHTPKPLLSLCGRPVMEYQIDLLKHAGIRRIIFAVGVMAEQVQGYFGNGDEYGMQFSYAIEEEPLGTAGAVRNCLPFLDGELTVVFNADILTDADLGGIIAQHKASGAEVTLTLQPVEDPSRYGVISTDETGRVTAFIEKPEPGTAPTNTINAGIYILNESAIRDIPSHRKVSIERETYPAMLATDRYVGSFLNERYWLDIGTAESFLAAHWDLLDRRSEGLMGAGEVRPGQFLAAPGAIPEGVTIVPPVFIDADVEFEGAATVGPYVCLNEGVRVGAGQQLSRIVALPGARILDEFEPDSIIGAVRD